MATLIYELLDRKINDGHLGSLMLGLKKDLMFIAY